VRIARAALAAAAIVSACSLTPVQVEVRTAVLEQLPAQVAQGTAHAATLLVLVPDAVASYDTTRIAYATAPHEVAYYAHVEWAERPARMMRPLLVQAMRATHAFAAVESPPYLEPFRYALRTEIRELRMDFAAAPPAARLVLHARLADADSGRTLLDRDVAVAEPIAARTPEAAITAANTAVAKALAQLAGEVVGAL
jgi:ABC-type uncharacterized transport system auxiliary subunit